MNWFKRIATAVGAFALVATMSDEKAEARVIISEKTVYYEISGNTGAKLFRSINKRGPRVRRVGHAIATTTASLQVRNVRTAVNKRRCRIANVDVVLDLTYRYPRWRGSRNASPEVRRNWERFLKRVVRHEERHGAISKKFARTIHDEIKGSKGRVSRKCKDFGKRAKQKLNRAAARHERAHRRFDQRENRSSARIRRLQAALIVSE
ncbi:MAG: DUF922 domain-containing protein [Pseudomonadota bacterium]